MWTVTVTGLPLENVTNRLWQSCGATAHTAYVNSAWLALHRPSGHLSLMERQANSKPSSCQFELPVACLALQHTLVLHLRSQDMGEEFDKNKRVAFGILANQFSRAFVSLNDASKPQRINNARELFCRASKRTTWRLQCRCRCDAVAAAQN